MQCILDIAIFLEFSDFASQSRDDSCFAIKFKLKYCGFHLDDLFTNFII